MPLPDVVMAAIELKKQQQEINRRYPRKSAINALLSARMSTSVQKDMQRETADVIDKMFGEKKKGRK